MKTLTAAKQIGIVILAAGSSSRLGQPKQLLSYKGTTLLRYVAETACSAAPTRVAVVLGAHMESLQCELQTCDVTVIENNEWEEGLSSSIRAALHLLGNDLDAILFMTVDQPLVDERLLHSIILTYLQSSSRVVASSYGGTAGIPALFDRTLFPDLLRLKGDQGAKEIIIREGKNARLVPFPNGTMDIDTFPDYETLRT